MFRGNGSGGFYGFVLKSRQVDDPVAVNLMKELVMNDIVDDSHYEELVLLVEECFVWVDSVSDE